MKPKRLICIVLIIAAIMCSSPVSTMAAGGNSSDNAGVYATRSIRFDIQPNAGAVSSSIMPLEVGETVVITAGYTPFSASLEVGIVDSNGQFYYTTFTGGNVDLEIVITKRGDYRLAVYNNSSTLVSLSGYVNY